MARLDYPATSRNREPILVVLRQVLPQQGVVLEIASGSGQHVAWFGASFPLLRWQPSSPAPEERASITAWTGDLGNVRPPLPLDTTVEPWPIGAADAMLCINMVHISPWAATLGLLAGAARVLPPGAPLVLYGPYMVDGTHTAPSNAAFDRSLRQRDSRWGVRDISEVVAAADGTLTLEQTFPMPANNLTLVFRRCP